MKTGVTQNEKNQQLVAELNKALFERELETYNEGISLIRLGSLQLSLESFLSMLDKFTQLVMNGANPAMEMHMSTMMNSILMSLQSLKMKSVEMKQAA